MGLPPYKIVWGWMGLQENRLRGKSDWKTGEYMQSLLIWVVSYWVCWHGSQPKPIHGLHDVCQLRTQSNDCWQRYSKCKPFQNLTTTLTLMNSDFGCFRSKSHRKRRRRMKRCFQVLAWPLLCSDSPQWTNFQL